MIHTFAAIYIGSYEVSIKIFEISGKKKIRDIDYIRSRIELGRDAYSKGSIGYELTKRSWTATGWTATKHMLPQP